jgi:hypothetical protein
MTASGVVKGVALDVSPLRMTEGHACMPALCLKHVVKKKTSLLCHTRQVAAGCCSAGNHSRPNLFDHRGIPHTIHYPILLNHVPALLTSATFPSCWAVEMVTSCLLSSKLELAVFPDADWLPMRVRDPDRSPMPAPSVPLPLTRPDWSKRCRISALPTPSATESRACRLLGPLPDEPSPSWLCPCLHRQPAK